MTASLESAKPSDDLAQDIAHRFRIELAMQRKPVSQSAIARALGMTQQNFSNRFRGHVPFRADELLRACRAAGLDVMRVLKDPAETATSPAVNTGAVNRHYLPRNTRSRTQMRSSTAVSARSKGCKNNGN